jgi:MoaA/NifB/PqqE/SkfB family radical SAM enzyme
MRLGIPQYLDIAKEITLSKLLKKRYPLTLYIALTDHCPMACIYCAIPSREKRELPTKLILRIIHEASSLGLKRLQLVGGEPLLKKDLAQIIEAANRHRIFITLTTSGTLIPQHIETLKNVDLIFVSLDGDEEIHDYHRGRGTFKKVLCGIKALKEAGIPYWTTTVITKKNYESLDYVIDLAQKGGHLANFQLLYTNETVIERHFHPAGISELALSHEERLQVCRQLKKLKNEGMPVGSSIAYFDYLLRWPDLTATYSKERIGDIPCSAGAIYCYLDTDEKLYPCGDAIGRTPGYPVTGPGGFNEAFDNLGPLPCESCIVACNVEQNLLFSLNLKTILNWLRSI